MSERTFDDVIEQADRDLARLSGEAEDVRRAQAETEQARRDAALLYQHRRKVAFYCVAFGIIWELGAHHPWPLILPGVALVVYGCAQEAKAKGWHLAWGAVGLLSLLGLLVVALLPNRTPRIHRVV